MTHVDFFLLSWVLLKPYTLLNRLNYNLNCLKLHLEMTPFSLKWILLSQIFVLREHLFLFGALLDIDFDSNLSYQNKKEISQSIFALVESNIAFQTRIFFSNGTKYVRWEKPGIENFDPSEVHCFVYMYISTQFLSSTVLFSLFWCVKLCFASSKYLPNSSQTELK